MSPTRRALSLLIALQSLLACRGDGPRERDGSPAGNEVPTVSDDPCATFRLGATCPLTLEPYGVYEGSFVAPGVGQSFLDIGLTGSTTYAAWAIEYPDGSKTPCDNPTFGIDQSCVVVVWGGGTYHLWVFEALGQSGTTNVTISRLQNLGSRTSPVPVSTDSLVNGSVGSGGSSYFSFEAGASAVHTIAVTGLFSQLVWELYGDRGFIDRVQECTPTNGPEGRVCRAPLTAGATYYLRVRELSGAPQEFQLTIGSGALDEGARERPVPLVVGVPRRPSTVDVFGHSYYTFTPDVSGPHAIQLDGHSIVADGMSYSFPGDYGWTLYDDPGFTNVVEECRDYRGILEMFEHCVASLTAGTPYYLRVDEQAGYPNRMHELTVVARAAGGDRSEGSIGAPVSIAFTDGWGSVSALGSSYYSFVTPPSGGSYRIIARSAQDNFYFAGSNLAWSLFDDPLFDHEIGRCDRATGIVAQSCLTPALAPSATYYVRVDERDGISQGFGLSLHGGFEPPTPSSPDTPVAIPLGSGGLDVVQDNTLSTGYYAFATEGPGTYRVAANLATGDGYALVRWHLYDDAALTREVAHCFKSDRFRWTPGVSCTVSLPGGTEFRMKVEAVGAASGDPASTIVGSNALHLVVEKLAP